MKKSTLQSALEIFCIPDETLRMLPRESRIEAMKFCAANDLPDVAIAREFAVPIDRVREITAGVR